MRQETDMLSRKTVTSVVLILPLRLRLRLRLLLQEKLSITTFFSLKIQDVSIYRQEGEKV